MVLLSAKNSKQTLRRIDVFREMVVNAELVLARL